MNPFPTVTRAVGTTNEILNVYFDDTRNVSSVGMANISSSSIAFSWCRDNSVAQSSGICSSQTVVGTYSTNSLTQISSTSTLGWYQYCPPNGMFASGRSVVLKLWPRTSTAGVASVNIQIDLLGNVAPVSVTTMSTPVGVSSATVDFGVSTLAASVSSVTGLVAVSTLATSVSSVTGSVNVSSYSRNAGVSTVAVLVGASTLSVPVGVSSASVNLGVSTLAASVSSVTGLVGVSTLSVPVGVSSATVNLGVSTIATSEKLVGVSTIAVGEKLVGVSTIAVSEKLVGVSSAPVLLGVSTISDKTGYALVSTDHASIADRFLGRNVSSGADGGRTVMEALYVLRNKVDLTAGVVYATDDTTSSWAFTTSTMPGDPLVSVDPA